MMAHVPNWCSGCTFLLDVLATNIPDIVSSTTTLSPLSNHCPVIDSLTLRAPAPQRTNLLHRIVDFNWLLVLMERERFLERLYGCETVDASWKAWESHLLNLVERPSTWTRKHDQRKQTWYTPDLRLFQRRQNRLYRAYICAIHNQLKQMQRAVYPGTFIARKSVLPDLPF